MIPPCRNCDGLGAIIDADGLAGPACPRCEGSQLDEAWQVAIASDRPGFAKVRIAYGAHAAARPLVDVELPAEAAELLLIVLGTGNRRGLIIRDRRAMSAVRCRHGQEIACLACVISTWPSDHMTFGDLVAAKEAIASARMAAREGAPDGQPE